MSLAGSTGDDDDEFPFLAGEQSGASDAPSPAKAAPASSVAPPPQPKREEPKTPAKSAPSPGGAGGTRGGPETVHNQPFDEAEDVSDEEESQASGSHEASTSGAGGPPAKSAPKAGGAPPPAKSVPGSAAAPKRAPEGAGAGGAGAGAGGAGAGRAPEPRAEDKKSPKKEHKKREFADGSGGEESQSDEEEEEEEAPAAAKPSQAKLYNPADYKHLMVSSEINDLFGYIGRYKPQDIELDTKLKPFIPDYIPAVGDIDAFIKVPPPVESFRDGLGLEKLDEPAAQQSDPGVLEMKIRVFSKSTGLKPMTVRSIEHADKNPRKVTTWINNIDDVHRKKPPPHVHYSKVMPEIETLMQAWPSEFEVLLKSTPLPSADMNMDLAQYVRVICALLDIPVCDKITESLHVLFTLYSEFKGNAHFQHSS